MTLQLKDPSLLVEACLIDGEFVGTPALDVTDPSIGAVVGRVPLTDAAGTTRAVEAAERALPAWKRLLAKERSRLLRRWYDLMIEHRDDLAPHHDLRAGQAARRSLGRDRLRRRLCRVLRRGGQAHRGRNVAFAKGRGAGSGDPRGGRRRGRHNALELPGGDDYPQGGAGPCRRLHGGGKARLRNAADRLGACPPRGPAPVCRRAFSTSSRASRR